MSQSQSQGSHRAVRRGGRGTRVQVKPSPGLQVKPQRVPEQGHGRPASYVPPMYTQAYGQLYGRDFGRDSVREAGRESVREAGSETKPGFKPGFPPPARYERNPYDTYRPSYETDGSAEPPARTPASPEPPRPEGGRAAARRAERARKAAQRPETLRRLVPQALVVAFLAGGTSAFVAHDKAVELSVDGSPRTLHTFADDVGELLAEEGVKVGEHDKVGPSPQQALANGDEITVHHGRPVDLTLDGTRHKVWTTERTVEGALRQLGVRSEGARLSLAPSAHIGRNGITLEVMTERGVTFLADGKEKTVRTNAATVLEALDEAGVQLGGLDTTSAPMESFPHDGQTITVMRITGREKVKEERMDFETVRQADPRLTEGTEVVARAGRPGIRRVTYRLRTVNGMREKPRRIAVEVVRRPQKEIIRVGTMPLPRSVPGADHLDWPALAQCESGGRPAAVDASGHYGGLYQFDPHTWRGLGGSGRPQDAPAEEQTYRAKKLYVSEGASPWPFCGRKLAR